MPRARLCARRRGDATDGRRKGFPKADEISAAAVKVRVDSARRKTCRQSLAGQGRSARPASAHDGRKRPVGRNGRQLDAKIVQGIQSRVLRRHNALACRPAHGAIVVVRRVCGACRHMANREFLRRMVVIVRRAVEVTMVRVRMAARMPARCRVGMVVQQSTGDVGQQVGRRKQPGSAAASRQMAHRTSEQKKVGPTFATHSNSEQRLASTRCSPAGAA